MLISLLCVIFVNFYNLYVHVYLETICVIAKFAIIYSLFGSNIYKSDSIISIEDIYQQYRGLSILFF